MGTVNAQNKTYDPILHYSYYSFFLGLRSTLFVLLFRTLFVSFSPFIFLSVFHSILQTNIGIYVFV